jgi:hypothetical protein
VKEPFSWPNNSEAIKSRGMAAQFTLTNASGLGKRDPLGLG